MAALLNGADTSWPSKEELAKAKEIRRSCYAEIKALSDPTRDVVGDLRLCRFLRFNKGDVAKATKGYREFLIWRKNEDIETLRKGIVDLSPVDFMNWVDTVRSPLGPAACLCLGDTPEGHMLVFASPGWFKAGEFVKQRPACHTMDTDLLIVRTCIEWVLKRIEDRSYAAGKMLYTIKVADMTNMGKEKIPIFVSEIRNFAKTNMPPIMQMYCEHDILILVINASFAFRVIWSFVSSLISKRQADRVKVFGSLTPEVQGILKALAEPDVFPTCIGGNRKDLPCCFPLAQDDPKRMAEWMGRTRSAVIRGQATACPTTRLEPLVPSVSMTVDSEGNCVINSDKVVAQSDAKAVARREAEEPIPSQIVNVREIATEPSAPGSAPADAQQRSAPQASGEPQLDSKGPVTEASGFATVCCWSPS